ncbi:MAG: hypothetical protein K2Q03_08875 [Sphingobacteriaceae bacterium]|nr:hypothetical protein [Sphingobacteriaceae bacterium]
MKALKITIAIIAFFAAILFIGGAYLPKTYRLKRSIVINAKDSVIFKNISNFNEFIKWSAWSKKCNDLCN